MFPLVILNFLFNSFSFKKSFNPVIYIHMCTILPFIRRPVYIVHSRAIIGDVLIRLVYISSIFSPLSPDYHHYTSSPTLENSRIQINLECLPHISVKQHLHHFCTLQLEISSLNLCSFNVTCWPVFQWPVFI